MLIDLNCDLGEGFPFDAELMPLITSANVCCGAHAGDEASIKRALKLALAHGVQVGAHPGFSDREHFGRRELPVESAQVLEECFFQVAYLRQLSGERVKYVKPHGAMYNM